MKLNLGCGKMVLEGYTNIDLADGPGVMGINLDRTEDWDFPFSPDSVTEIRADHLIEHIVNPLKLMQALWMVAAPGCLCTFRCPYGSSDDADEDPTHVRRYYKGSWGYFSQPYYWRADYGYRGDWQPETVELCLCPGYRHIPRAIVHEAVRASRNVVEEMTVTLRAIKPIRESRRELQVFPTVSFR